jgi:hypothetical protein
MFNPASIFRSRWSALLWVASICWLAAELTEPSPQLAAPGAGQAQAQTAPVSALEAQKREIEALRADLVQLADEYENEGGGGVRPIR